MRCVRLLPVALSFAAIPATPLAARAVQQEVVVWRPADDYATRSERIRRDRIREEQDALQGNFATVDDAYVEDPCGFGCDDHLGLQSRGIPGTPLVAVVHEASREDGVLTLRLRFYNDGSEPARLRIDPAGDPEACFVRAGQAKLRVLEDEDGELEAKDPLDVALAPGEMESWWARFPAPPADTANIDVMIPPVAAFTDVPVSGN